MLPHKHFIFGGIFSLLIYFILEITFFQATLIFLVTFFIDVDHYLYYVYKKKDFSLKNAYGWFIKQKIKLMNFPRKKRNKTYTGFFFLHGLEIVVIFSVLGFLVSDYFHFISFGILFHLSLDYFHQSNIHDRLDRFSLIYDFIKLKKLKYLGD